MLESICWFLLFIVIYACVHYQFKYCIPVGLVVLKIVESLSILMAIRAYVYFRIYEPELNLKFVNDYANQLFDVIAEMIKNKQEL